MEYGCSMLHSLSEGAIHRVKVVCAQPNKVKPNMWHAGDHMYWEPLDMHLGRKTEKGFNVLYYTLFIQERLILS